MPIISGSLGSNTNAEISQADKDALKAEILAQVAATGLQPVIGDAGADYDTLGEVEDIFTTAETNTVSGIEASNDWNNA